MRTITRLSAVSIALLATATGESQAAPPTFDATRTGYWSVIFFNDTGNSIYATSPATRSFFRFDPASVGDADVVTSAVLSITRHQSGRGNEPVEQIGLFDVSTDQAVLHDTKFGLGFRTDIAELVFEDLGTGANFGEFNVRGDGNPEDVLHFRLSPTVVNAINSARGGLFSVGAAFLNFDSANEGIFFNAGGIQRLSINEAADAIPALPEPSSLSLAAAALAGLLVFRCCRKPG